MTDDLRQLAAWLTEAAVGAVAMESTGVFWKPIWNLLEDGPFALVLANAQHIKQVPGRKTDVKLRHEVVSVAVGPEPSRPNLVICHQYPTAACGWSNPTVRSPRDN